MIWIMIMYKKNLSIINIYIYMIYYQATIHFLTNDYQVHLRKYMRHSFLMT